MNDGAYGFAFTVVAFGPHLRRINECRGIKGFTSNWFFIYVQDLNPRSGTTWSEYISALSITFMVLINIARVQISRAAKNSLLAEIVWCYDVGQ